MSLINHSTNSIATNSTATEALAVQDPSKTNLAWTKAGVFEFLMPCLI